jgi:hypothetical protein
MSSPLTPEYHSGFDQMDNSVGAFYLTENEQKE